MAIKPRSFPCLPHKCAPPACAPRPVLMLCTLEVLPGVQAGWLRSPRPILASPIHEIRLPRAPIVFDLTESSEVMRPTTATSTCLMVIYMCLPQIKAEVILTTTAADGKLTASKYCQETPDQAAVSCVRTSMPTSTLTSPQDFRISLNSPGLGPAW